MIADTSVSGSAPSRSAGWAGALLLCAVLASPPLVSAAILNSRYGTLDGLAVWNAGMSVLWLVVLHAWTRRPLWLHLALAPLYVATAADLFLILRFHARLTTSYITILFTDYTETWEFVRAYQADVALGCIFLAVVYVTGLLSIRRVHLSAPPWLRYAALGLLLAGYAVPLARQARGMSLAQAGMDVAAHDLSSPIGVLAQAFVASVHLAQTRDLLDERRTSTLGAHRLAPRAGPEIYVLVIGESARPDRWSLGGYARETNPRLAQLANLTFFRDFLTTAPHTAIAVPSLLSLAPIADWSAIAAQRSIVSAFREAGFRTAWLSTQEVSSWGGIINQIAEEAESRRYFDRMLDDALVDALQSELKFADESSRLFVVLHTRGNHFGTTKYPAEFRRYEEAGGDRRQDLGNAYDNGILFTDWVLSRVIELVRSRNARSAVLYVSDHGENLMDEGELYGHAIGNEYDLRTAALFWASDRLVREAPEMVAAVHARASSRLNHENVAHSLLDLAGIDARGLDRSKSLFSDGFRESRRLYRVRGTINEYPPSRGARDAHAAPAGRPSQPANMP